MLDLDLLGSNLYNGHNYLHQYQDQSDWTDLCTSLSSDPFGQLTTLDFSAQPDDWSKIQTIDDFLPMTGNTFDDFLSYDLQAPQFTETHPSQMISPSIDLNTAQTTSQNEPSILYTTIEDSHSAPTKSNSYSLSPAASSTTPPSSTTSANSPKDISTPNSNHSHANPDKVKKRTLNTIAARRYRQKKVDQVVGLEAALQESEKEKDELRLRVARLEAEVDVLRGLVGKK